MKRLASTIALLLIATVSRATCPTPTVYYSWQTTSVSYAFPPNSPPPCWAGESISALGIDNDIHAAFNQWTYADQNQNSTNTAFYASTSGVPFRVYAQTVVDPSSCGVSVAAQTLVGIYSGTNIVVVATTSFYLGSTSTLGFANYDQSASNYHTFIQKVMAHEIGHTMGLDDQPLGGGTCGGQAAGESVMNAACGTNDSANNMPAPMIGLPNCDNASVH